MSGLTYLLVSIVLEVTGTSFLIASQGFRRLVPSAVAIVSWVAAVVLFSRALQTISVGAAYALWSGLGTLLIALIGVIVYRQRIDPAGVVGIGLIVSGVVVLRVFSAMELG